MPARSQDILTRTKHFSLRIVRLYASLPRSQEGQIIGKQILRSGTSVGAHLREGKYSRSDSEMLSKISVALQELEESRYWMELLGESDIVSKARLTNLLTEIDELAAILYASKKSIRKHAAHP